MGFYPRYFDEGVANNSDIYNYYEWNEKNRATAAQHIKSDTREQPKAQQELEQVTVRFLPPPGGIILFSGAQLHETVPNEAGVARYSIDFRTVHFDDVVAGEARLMSIRAVLARRYATIYGRAISRLFPMTRCKLYDDGTEAHSSVLYFGDRLVNTR